MKTPIAYQAVNYIYQSYVFSRLMLNKKTIIVSRTSSETWTDDKANHSTANWMKIFLAPFVSDLESLESSCLCTLSYSSNQAQYHRIDLSLGNVILNSRDLVLIQLPFYIRGIWKTRTSNSTHSRCSIFKLQPIYFCFCEIKYFHVHMELIDIRLLALKKSKAMHLKIRKKILIMVEQLYIKC